MLVLEAIEQTHDSLLVSAAPEAGRAYWTVQGLAGRYDFVNQNGRLYPREVVDEAISALSGPLGLITRGNFLSELDHPEPNPSGERVPLLKNTCGVITKFWTGEPDGNGGPIYFEANIADTEYGRQIVSLIQAGAKIGASTRGQGHFDVTTVANRMVAVARKGFRFMGLDWVSFPSVADAGIEIVESLELDGPYVAPQPVREAAAEGFNRDDGDTFACYTPALRLIEGKGLTDEKLDEMLTFFEQDLDTSVEQNETLFLLRGGAPGREWAREVRQMTATEMKTKESDLQPSHEGSTPAITASNLGALNQVMAGLVTLITNFAQDQDFWDVDLLADLALQISWLRTGELIDQTPGDADGPENAGYLMDDDGDEANRKRLADAIEKLCNAVKDRHESAERAKAVPTQESETTPEVAVVEEEDMSELKDVVEALSSKLTTIEESNKKLEGLVEKASLREAVFDAVRGERHPFLLMENLMSLVTNPEEIEARMEQAKILVEAEMAKRAEQPTPKTVVEGVDEKRRQYTEAERYQIYLAKGRYPD